MQETADKIALITGANEGMGLEVASQLGRAGCINIPDIVLRDYKP